MKFNYKWTVLIALTCSGLSYRALADCIISEESKLLDPVEAGFCASDAVFVGKVEGSTETIGGVTEEGSTITKHFDTQRSTVRVLDLHKGALPDKVTMIADLYAKERAYVFESGKTYLVFAKRLAGENEYVGANAACSVQTTLRVDEAGKALKQLEEHKMGRKKIDCKNIRPK